MSSNVIVSRGHSRPLTEISFVEDSFQRSLLVSAAHDKIPQIRDGETGDWIGSFQGHKGAVWSTKVDTLTRTLAVTASGDFTAKLWCATSGKELCEYKHKHVVKSVDFSHDTERIATGCQDGLLRIYTTSTPQEAPVICGGGDGSPADPITKCCWGLDANTVICGRRSGSLEMWDMRTETVRPTQSIHLPTVGEVVGPSSSIMDIELHNTRQSLLVACGKQVNLLSAADFSLTKQITMPDTMTFAEEGGASLHPSGSRIMAGASDLWLREFDVETGECLRTFKGHHGPIRCVRYHPFAHCRVNGKDVGEIVASGSEDATIRLWSI